MIGRASSPEGNFSKSKVIHIESVDKNINNSSDTVSKIKRTADGKRITILTHM